MIKYFLIVFGVFLIIGCKKNEIVINNPPPVPEVKIPTITTEEISNLTRYSVILAGEFSNAGKGTIEEQGFVVDTMSMPTTTRNLHKFSLSLDSIKTFSITVVGFPANKSYYIRAYARNSYGVGYGNEVKFTSFQEKIFKGFAILTTQQQVVDFGKNEYSRIDGDLIIDGPVTDLAPLKSLVVINNNFSVKNTLLVNFKGLENLEFVGYIFPNGFRVQNNQKLIDFSGLTKLSISRGEFYVTDNNSLESMNGLDSFKAVGSGEFRIRDCKKIQNLNGLRKLVFVGSSLHLMNNPSLTDIKGLGNLSTIGQGLNIINNATLQNLDGLEKIENLPWGVELRSNNSLTDIKGLNNLSSVGSLDYEAGSITIYGNGALKDLSAFTKITKADFVQIQNNDVLSDLNGLNNLQSVKVSLDIKNNSSLSDLSGLKKLTSAGSLEISYNPSLVNLKGLDSLKTIYTNTLIVANNKLQSLTGLENFTRLGSSLRIFSNSSLTDFCALKSLFIFGWFNQLFSAENNATNPSKNDIITNCH